jgi:hypothetical protein
VSGTIGICFVQPAEIPANAAMSTAATIETIRLIVLLCAPIGRAFLLPADKREDQLPEFEVWVGAGDEGADSAQPAARAANAAISTAPTIRSARLVLLFIVINRAFRSRICAVAPDTVCRC